MYPKNHFLDVSESSFLVSITQNSVDSFIISGIIQAHWQLANDPETLNANVKLAVCWSNKVMLQGSPIPVINGVITPISEQKVGL